MADFYCSKIVCYLAFILDHFWVKGVFNSNEADGLNVQNIYFKRKKSVQNRTYLDSIRFTEELGLVSLFFSFLVGGFFFLRILTQNNPKKSSSGTRQNKKINETKRTFLMFFWTEGFLWGILFHGFGQEDPPKKQKKGGPWLFDFSYFSIIY